MQEEKITNNIKIPNKNLEKLKKDFPECFDKNGNFDLEKFKQELTENKIDFSKESYGVDWLWKSYARLLASDNATTFLKEDEEFNQKLENKNSKNLLIKWDNLEVLKHLSNAYYEKIKMIYIDPPYNTGSDWFVYQDDRKFTVKELSTLAWIDEEKAKRILDFTQSKSNSHSAWLTFMYPRLYIARQLLKDDWVIFVSIDDNEVAQLRLLMDEIFGEENFVGQIIWEKKYSPANDSNKISDTHDYIIWFSKNINNWEMGLFDRTKEMNARYKNIDNDPRWNWKPGWLSAKTYSSLYDYEIKTPSWNIVRPPSWKSWSVSKERFEELLKDNRIYFGVNNDSKPQIKQFLTEVKQWYVPKSLWFKEEAWHNQTSTRELEELFNKKVFDNPKPTKLLKRILKISNVYNNDLILDFFAWSGTTADAVMQLNAEDWGNRKFILVQIPEEIDPKKNKTAYDFVKNELKVEKPTIFEITKERILRAGKKIKLENEKAKNDEKKDLSNVDFGFKIFETTPIWENYNFEAEEFDENLKLFDESVLTKQDLKTILTTWKTYDGLALTESLEEIDLWWYTWYYANSKLYLVDKWFKTENLKNILEKIDSNPDFNPASIIAFGYNFESKFLREIAENIKSYANKKEIDVDFVVRW